LPEDVPALVALINSAYRGDSSRRGWTTEADLLGGQRTDAAAMSEVVAGGAGRRMMIAETDGALLGCCQLEHRPSDAAYFGMFAVRPGRQGKGVGRQILAEAERIALVDWGAGRMRMTVLRQRLDILAWYERRGYHRTGETAPFPYGDERYGLPTRPDLEFVVLEKALSQHA
jgi:GNAT superfamily N-acetyltransferase